MNGGEIKKEVGEKPTMGCYVRLTLVAISVLCGFKNDYSFWST